MRKFVGLIFVFSTSYLVTQSIEPHNVSAKPPVNSEATTKRVVTAPMLCDANPQELIRTSSEKDIQNRFRRRNYTYIERQENHELSGDGSVKKTEVFTYEHFVAYGSTVQRLIAKDDKPLDEKEMRKEEERIQKIIDKRKNETEEDRLKKETRLEKQREEERKLNLEIADAFEIKLQPEEELNGRTACVYDFTPKPGYQPQGKEAKILMKAKGRVWVDKQELQLVKLDAEFIDSVNWGFFIAKLSKGSRVNVEQVKVNDEVWLPKHVAVKLDARLMLLKHFNMDIDITYKDYKKFNTSSKISVVGEVEEKKDELPLTTTPIKKN
jgi:hypothetical protein